MEKKSLEKAVLEDVVKKLSLWHTRTFRPIMTHEDLEPLMASIGFVPVPVAPTAPGHVAWKEYAFPAAASPPLSAYGRRETDRFPRPRLPFPRIDGLHLLTYQAFLETVGFYVGLDQVPDYFHVRSMPFHRTGDGVLDKVYRRMNNDRMIDDEGLYVYRDGTLDQITLMACNNSSNKDNNNSGSNNSTTTTTTKLSCVVPLKDIIVSLG